MRKDELARIFLEEKENFSFSLSLPLAEVKTNEKRNCTFLFQKTFFFFERSEQDISNFVSISFLNWKKNTRLLYSLFCHANCHIFLERVPLVTVCLKARCSSSRKLLRAKYSENVVVVSLTLN